jgi:formate hydrogenlyase subunit 6/NADH:ubiquinone oxidoreductase subunit I
MATRTTKHARTMEQCIESCTNCHRICLETAARHFAGESSPRLEEPHVRLLLDGSEICRRCAESCREMAGATA